MSWNIQLIGPRAAVAAAVVNATTFPLRTGVAKDISFSPDPNPWVALRSTGEGENVHCLSLLFFTPLDAVSEVPAPTPQQDTAVHSDV